MDKIAEVFSLLECTAEVWKRLRPLHHGREPTHQGSERMHSLGAVIGGPSCALQNHSKQGQTQSVGLEYHRDVNSHVRLGRARRG